MKLFFTRRFFPLFVTQFFSAFNDNLFKNALVILITYKIAANNSAYAAQLVNLAFGLFMLPTLLFSYLSGQLADKFDRARVARWVKLAEIFLALAGSMGIYTNNLTMLFICLFGFGMHSAFFGPVKYAILPQHLKQNELIKGNGYIDAGTFLAILSGTMLGGLLVLRQSGTILTSLMMIAIAVTGYLASRRIPEAPAPAPAMKLAFNPFTETCAMLKYSIKRREEFTCIIGISWFWFMGATFVAQFSPFARNILHADEGVVTLFLVAFSVGVAIGSLLCTLLSKGGTLRVNYVPKAAFAMSIFALDLYHTSRHISIAADAPLITISDFLSHFTGQHILIDLLGLAISGGIYIVPLYALLQIRADKQHVARAIASNNMMNAVFMIIAALFAMLMIKWGCTIPQIFLAVAVLNAGAAVYIRKI